MFPNLRWLPKSMVPFRRFPWCLRWFRSSSLQWSGIGIAGYIFHPKGSGWPVACLWGTGWPVCRGKSLRWLLPTEKTKLEVLPWNILEEPCRWEQLWLEHFTYINLSMIESSILRNSSKSEKVEFVWLSNVNSLPKSVVKFISEFLLGLVLDM